MARKKSPPTPSTEVSGGQLDLVAAVGDVADATAIAAATGGMDMDAYCAAIYAGIDEAYGDASVYVVARVLDEHVADLLEFLKQYEGRVAAYDAAINFAKTILPYAQLPEVSGAVSYRALKEKHDET